MLQKFFGTFALFVLLLGPASQAMADERDILEENLPEVLAKLRENQLFYRDSMAVLGRLDGVEYGFGAAEDGSVALEEALDSAARELDIARGEIAALKTRRKALQPPVIGAPSYDQLFAASWKLIAGLPDTLTARIVLLESMGEALRNGDVAAQDRLDSEATFQRLRITEGETANLRVSLALVDERHPQHGLTRAWVASNDANAALTRAIAELFAGDAVDFHKLVEDLNNGARIMQAAISDGRDRTEKIGVPEIAQAYRDAFDLEAQIAEVNRGYGDVFAILVPEDGSWSDDDIVRVNELDARLSSLVQSRTQLTIERTQLVQSMIQ